MRRYSDKMQRIRDFVDPLGDPRRVNSEIKWHGREIRSHWNQVCLSHVTCCCALTLHIFITVQIQRLRGVEAAEKGTKRSPRRRRSPQGDTESSRRPRSLRELAEEEEDAWGGADTRPNPEPWPRLEDEDEEEDANDEEGREDNFSVSPRSAASLILSHTAAATQP